MSNIKYGKVLSCALHGIEGVLVEIEVALLPGLPHFEIVGLGDSAVRESRNRVHAAIRSSGYIFPQGRLTASYAPAWLPKEGTSFDLALALAVLLASGQLRQSRIGWLPCVFGELSLNGQVKPLPGVICRASACLEQGIGEVLLPAANYYEVAALENCKPYPVADLREAARIMAADSKYCEVLAENSISAIEQSELGIKHRNATAIQDTDTKQVQINLAGQKRALRAVCLAAAGWHHSLLIGSPGCGKTTLARVLPAIMPPINKVEAQLVTRIHSAAGKITDASGLILRRVFMSPHHTVTRAALLGGGRRPMPGICSLAHLGVLFLDEMTQFDTQVLDGLRQPLEEQRIHISRMSYQVEWPADFLMIGAANPCRCGEYLEPDSSCRCSEEQVKSHMLKISGPLLDRIDLAVEMTRLTSSELPESVSGSQSTVVYWQMRREIARCWQVQLERCLENSAAQSLNGKKQSNNLAAEFRITREILRFTADCADQLRLSARGYVKTLRLARTIADYEKSDKISREHIAEALQYRFRQAAAGELR